MPSPVFFLLTAPSHFPQLLLRTVATTFRTVRFSLQPAAPFPLQYINLFLPSLLFPIQLFSAANPLKTWEHTTDVRNNQVTDWCAWRPVCSSRSQTGGRPARPGIFPSCPADHSATFPLLVGRCPAPGQLTGTGAGLTHQLACWKGHTDDAGFLATAGMGQFLLGLCCLFHWQVLRACGAHQCWNETAATVQCKTVSRGLFQSESGWYWWIWVWLIAKWIYGWTEKPCLMRKVHTIFFVPCPSIMKIPITADTKLAGRLVCCCFWRLNSLCMLGLTSVLCLLPFLNPWA